jgi:hypothetical protein
MNDLDDLRAALHEPPGFTPRPVDLATVMRTGGRIRRRRRLTVGATTGLAVVALLIGGNVLVQRTTPDDRGGFPIAAQPSTALSSSAAAAPKVIRTGLTESGGEWVLYPKPINEAAIPQTTFGLMLGWSVKGGEPVDAVMANESSGFDRSPGFHAVQGRMEIDQGVTPTFGYYVGPATKITAKAGSKKLTAEQAPLDDSIQVFWFDAGNVKNLTAYAADGRKLPTGNAEPGVG